MNLIAMPAGSEPELRLKGLDGLRGIAACVVAFGFHTQFMFAQGVFAPGAGGPIAQWLRDFGWAAVDLFFVLSGFVFAHVYLTNARYARISLREFVVARIARLYPLHIATLLLCAVIPAALPNNGPGAFIAHLFMVQALFSPAGHTFNGPAWSISIEALCYLIFAAGLWGQWRALHLYTALALIAGLIGTLSFAPEMRVTVETAISRGLLGFFAGQALWLNRAWFAKVPTPILAIVALAAIVVDPGGLSAVIPLTLVAWPALLLLALRVPALSARPLLWLGDRSYAIYLLHMPLIDLVHYCSRGGLDGSAASMISAHLGLVAITLLLADITWRWFELPMRKRVRDALDPPERRGAARIPAEV